MSYIGTHQNKILNTLVKSKNLNDHLIQVNEIQKNTESPRSNVIRDSHLIQNAYKSRQKGNFAGKDTIV